MQKEEDAKSVNYSRFHASFALRPGPNCSSESSRSCCRLLWADRYPQGTERACVEIRIPWTQNLCIHLSSNDHQWSARQKERIDVQTYIKTRLWLMPWSCLQSAASPIPGASLLARVALRPSPQHSKSRRLPTFEWTRQADALALYTFFIFSHLLHIYLCLVCCSASLWMAFKCLP